MDISLPGNPMAMTALAGAAEALPAAEGAPVHKTPSQEKPNLVVTETPAPPGAGGIPPAELEKAMVRDDALGKFIDKALGAEQLRAQLTGGLLPGEKVLIKDELDRVVVRA